jgi:hypothetical protein
VRYELRSELNPEISQAAEGEAVNIPLPSGHDAVIARAETSNGEHATGEPAALERRSALRDLVRSGG